MNVYLPALMLCIGICIGFGWAMFLTRRWLRDIRRSLRR